LRQRLHLGLPARNAAAHRPQHRGEDCDHA
jgi:hypothetical protein